MRQNVASQVIGAQMVSATDGSAFTGSASVLVTVDGGTQGAGGGTGPTHEGNGFHSYIPTQAETNGAHIAFTFTGSGAIPVTIQVYTTDPQTGDSYARLGAPAGASIAADIVTVDGVVDAILVDTAEIGAAGAGLTAIPWNASWDAEVQSEAADALNAYDPPTRAELTTDTSSILTRLGTPAGADIAADLATIDANVDATVADTNELQTDWVDGGRLDVILDARASQTSVDTVDSNVDAILADTGTDGVALTAAAVDAILDEVVEGSYTFRQYLRLFAAALGGQLSGAATTTITIRDTGDSADRITATVDADGNRSAVVLNLT